MYFKNDMIYSRLRLINKRNKKIQATPHQEKISRNPLTVGTKDKSKLEPKQQI